MTSWTGCLTTSKTVALLDSCHAQRMANSLSPRVRAAIINYDPTQPNALTVTEFCRSVKISRSVFYKIRRRRGSGVHGSTAPAFPGPEDPGQAVRPRGHQRTGPDP